MSDAIAPVFYHMPYAMFLDDVQALARQVGEGAWRPDFIIGIGRGGLVPAVYVSHQLAVPMLSVDHSSRVPGFAEELLDRLAANSAQGTRLLFVDDINDSGGTITTIRDILVKSGCLQDNLRFAVLVSNTRSTAQVDYSAQLIDRSQDKRWFVFPWEAVATAGAIAQEAQSVPERLA